MTATSNLPTDATWSPFGESIDNLFEGFFRPVAKPGTSDGVATPAVDIVEKDNCLEVKVNIPGVKKDDLDISIHDGVLEISAETKSETEEKDGERVLRRERRYGRYARAIHLGADIEEDALKANYQDGVLTVVAPKTKRPSPKRVTVQLGE